MTGRTVLLRQLTDDRVVRPVDGFAQLVVGDRTAEAPDLDDDVVLPRLVLPGTRLGEAVHEQLCAVHRVSPSTGFTSTMGVPSTASRFDTRTRVPSIARTVTRCSPTGLGRCGARVVNTPCRGRLWSPRGCTRSRSRRVVQPGQQED